MGRFLTEKLPPSVAIARLFAVFGLVFMLLFAWLVIDTVQNNQLMNYAGVCGNEVTWRGSILDVPYGVNCPPPVRPVRTLKPLAR